MVIPSVLRHAVDPLASVHPSDPVIAGGAALAAAGLVIGAAQAIVLRASVGNTAWVWVPATVIGGGLAGVLTSALSSQLIGFSSFAFISLLAAVGAFLISAKWLGRCPECGNWNSYVEEQVRAEPASRTGARRVSISSAQPMPLAQVRFTQANRLRLAMRELNQVLGGGIVPGSLVLVGGDPGIGKSTLLLQLASEVAGSYGPVLYVSGEESVQQLKLRAQRLGIEGDRLMVLAENDLDGIVEHLEKARPMMAVIDSGEEQPHPDFPRGPRQQGGRDRRAARARAHCRHRPLPRG